MSNHSVLLIFIRNPELGKVKTRLAESVGDEMALKIYMALMAHTRALALQLPVDRWLFYSHFIDKQDNWENEKFSKKLQTQGDLGVKMQVAFQAACEQYQKVMIIGSDCVSLTPQIIQEGFDALDQHSFVLGPAIDGGYYLLGMRQFTPSLFQHIPWSTAQVAELTLIEMERLGRTCYLLPTLSDIDYAEDWEAYGWEI